LLLGPEPPEDVAEADAVLHLAAMAAMTDLALVESRQQVEDELRGTFLEELRAGVQLDAAEVIRRGERLGCDLSTGALILAADPVVEVLGSSGLGPDSLADGTYRLLVRLLASEPEQLDAFYEESVAPLARYDDQYRTDLIGTLAAYLDHDGKLGAAAQALYAH